MGYGKMVPWIAVASALMLMASGCGGSANLVPVNPSSSQNSRTLSPSAAPIVVQPSPYMPTQPLPNTGVTTQQLQFTKSVKNGIISKIVVTVVVTNPTMYPLTGEVKVTFTDGGKPTSKVQTETVTVQAMDKVTLTFEDPSWLLDDAIVEVTTQNAGYDPHGSTLQNPVAGGYPYAY